MFRDEAKLRGPEARDLEHQHLRPTPCQEDTAPLRAFVREKFWLTGLGAGRWQHSWIDTEGGPWAPERPIPTHPRDRGTCGRGRPEYIAAMPPSAAQLRSPGKGSRQEVISFGNADPSSDGCVSLLLSESGSLVYRERAIGISAVRGGSVWAVGLTGAQAKSVGQPVRNAHSCRYFRRSEEHPCMDFNGLQAAAHGMRLPSSFVRKSWPPHFGARHESIRHETEVEQAHRVSAPACAANPELLGAESYHSDDEARTGRCGHSTHGRRSPHTTW